MSWFPKRSVVVPVDFSEESFAAVDVALDLVADPEHVHIVHGKLLECQTPRAAAEA